MTVLFNRPYLGYTAGQIATLDNATESALVTQGIAVTSAAAQTSGAVTVNATKGRAFIAIGASTVVVTNSFCAAESTVLAVVSQSAADATLTQILRCAPAAGSFTIVGNANATAATQVDWVVLNNSGAAGVIR